MNNDEMDWRKGDELDEWSFGEIRSYLSKKVDTYTIYHMRQKGRVTLTYRELCQLGELVERMISEAQ